jgi:antitoxin VapB
MGVQLNIKDPETVRLARELAGQTRRTVTETVRAALQKMAEEREEAIARKKAAILAAIRAIPFDHPAAVEGSVAIAKDFHEQEWQEQYGRDQWS